MPFRIYSLIKGYRALWVLGVTTKPDPHLGSLRHETKCLASHDFREADDLGFGSTCEL